VTLIIKFSGHTVWKRR